MANINKYSPKQLLKQEEALELASKDLIAFGKLFLPDDYMRSETPPFHYEIADAITNKENQQVAIILPRGHGKTVLTKADILQAFCFTKEPLFYGWVSATAKLATGNMDYIKYHLELKKKNGQKQMLKQLMAVNLSLNLTFQVSEVEQSFIKDMTL